MCKIPLLCMIQAFCNMSGKKGQACLLALSSDGGKLGLVESIHFSVEQATIAAMEQWMKNKSPITTLGEDD